MQNNGNIRTEHCKEQIGNINGSAFASAYASIVEMGYSPIPIKPGEKFPGLYRGMREGYIAMSGWQQYCDAPAEDWQLTQWATRWPDAGIGVAHNAKFGAVDFDEDVGGCHAEIQALLAGLYGSVVRRKGRNGDGYAQYFRLDGSVKSRVYRVKDVGNYLEVLAQGRQTVLPPTIHPKTQNPYYWVTDDTLENTELHNLPEITAEIVEKIEEILRAAGWDPEADKPARAGGQRTTRSKGGGNINDWAMADLHLWVPDLPIARLKRKGAGYVGVADWRPGGTGRPVSERKLNLSIQPQGIKDFGTDKGYSPAELVADGSVRQVLQKGRSCGVAHLGLFVFA